MRLTLNETGCHIQMEMDEKLDDFIPWMKRIVEQCEEGIPFFDAPDEDD